MTNPLPLENDFSTKNHAAHEETKPGSANDKLRMHPNADALKEQRRSSSANLVGDLSSQGSAAKHLPEVTIEATVLPTDSAQAQFMQLLQVQLSSPSLLKIIIKPDPSASETADQFTKRTADRVASRAQAIHDEMRPDPPAEPYWGPASQEAFRDYISFVQSQVVPGAVAALASAALPEPSGNPLKLPPGMAPTDYETQVITNKLKLDLGIDYHKIPGAKETAELRNAASWASKAMDNINAARSDLRTRQINTTIDKMGFPSGWHGGYTGDKSSWMNSASDMIDLYSRAARAISVIDSNHMPIPLPTGIRLTRNVDGKIDHIVMSMPDDLRQEDPRNAATIAGTRAWLEAADAKIKNALRDKNLPTLTYADTVVPQVSDANGNKKSAQARLDVDGNLVDLINPSKVPASKRQNAHDINLLEERYTTEQVFRENVAARVKVTGEIVQQSTAVWSCEKQKLYHQLPVPGVGSFSKEQLKLLKENGDQVVYNAALEHNVALDSPEGYVKVSQHVQAQNVPFFSPQNLVYLNVGKPMALEERFYRPDDLVAVRNGVNTEYITAKDLGSIQESQAFGFYGQKAVVLGMDAAMLTLGGVEVVAAVESASALGAAEATMSASQLLLTAGKGVFDLSLGATDPLSNAYFVSRDGGNAANIRSWVFMGSIGLGLAEQGAQLFSNELALGQTQTVPELGRLIESTYGAVKLADKVAREAMLWGQIPLGVPMVANLVNQLVNFEQPTADGTVAAQAIKEYKVAGSQSESKTEKRANSLAQNVTEVTASLENYKTLFADHVIGKDASAKISSLFDQAKFVNSSSSDQQRTQFLRNVATNIQFSGAELAHLEQLYGGKLAQNQIKELMHPVMAVKSSYPKNVTDYALRVLAERDQDLVRASEVILLSLSRDKDGRVLDQVVSSSIDVGNYITREDVDMVDLWGHQSRGHFIGHQVSAEKQVIDLDRELLTSLLSQNLSQSNIGSEGIAIGDTLGKAGSLSVRGLGAQMQDLLLNNEISDEQKMRLLAGEGAINLAEVIVALRAQEKLDDTNGASSTSRTSGANFGTNASDLEKVLTDVAAKAKSADLKLMLGALLTVRERLTLEQNPALQSDLTSPDDRGRNTMNLSQLDDFATNVISRYPDLASFDLPKQTEWLKNNFPLLCQSNFMNEARQAISDDPAGLFTSTVGAAQAAIDETGRRRIAQFNSLLALAEIDPGSATSHGQKTAIEEARAVLSSIILSNGDVVTHDTENFQPRQKMPSFEHETRVDWSAQAANCLLRISERGNSERDLTAAYVSRGLARKPLGATKSTLIEAWKNLDGSPIEVSLIPSKLYSV